MIDEWQELDRFSKQHGDSFFVLSGATFRKNFEDLQHAFTTHYENVKIGYSYKTNYTPQLCEIVDEIGGYAEVVSEMEYELAVRLGISGNRIIYNGPYKSVKSFKSAATSGATINLDGQRDLDLLSDLASSHPGQQFAVVIRVNFNIDNSEISRFGMDVNGSDFKRAMAMISSVDNLSLKGLHCHLPNRDLDSFKQKIATMLKLSREIFTEKPPQILNIGGGYFSNMPESLRSTFKVPPATFSDYGEVIGTVMQKEFSRCENKPTLFLEPGTAIVADTQKFYTRVIAVKKVSGRNFAFVAGSGFDISPVARSKNLPVRAIHQPTNSAPKEKFDIVGFTCIESDVLSVGFEGTLEAGDFLEYSNVGSYSIVMRPPFILPSHPILFEDVNQDIKLIKSRQSTEQVFQNYII